MRPALDRILTGLIAGFLASGAGAGWAAKAPRGPEKLKKEASHVISGRVVEVTSKTQESTVETAAGVHRDRVFTITVQVETVSKGEGVAAGDRIEVIAWQPSSRIPPLPGLQGHESIPRKGDTATFYLKGGRGGPFEPLLPNGIVIGKRAE